MQAVESGAKPRLHGSGFSYLITSISWTRWTKLCNEYAYTRVAYHILFSSGIRLKVQTQARASCGEHLLGQNSLQRLGKEALSFSVESTGCPSFRNQSMYVYSKGRGAVKWWEKSAYPFREQPREWAWSASPSNGGGLRGGRFARPACRWRCRRVETARWSCASPASPGEWSPCDHAWRRPCCTTHRWPPAFRAPYHGPATSK